MSRTVEVIGATAGSSRLGCVAAPVTLFQLVHAKAPQRLTQCPARKTGARRSQPLGGAIDLFHEVVFERHLHRAHPALLWLRG